jgi:chromosome segregation ATPase
MMLKKLVSSRFATALILTGAAISVAGCSTTDPNQGGFLGGVAGLASGNYAQGTKEKRVALQNEQDKKIALERSASRVNQQSAALSLELAKTEVRLQSIEDDLTKLDAKLASANVGTEAARRQLAELQKKSDALSSDIDRERLTFSDDSSSQKVKDLERRKRELEEQIELFLLQS